MQPKSPSRGRLLAFSLITTLLFLFGLNVLIEGLESRGVLSTWRSDDRIQFLPDSPPAHLSAPPPPSSDAATSGAASKGVGVPSDDGDWRMYTHGGSFALGTPYRMGNFEEDKRGGMSDFIEMDLRARFPDVDSRVHPRAQGSIGSGMVASIVQRNLRSEPDLIFLATCNNEGSVNPSEITKSLNKLGGYRLLKRLLKPEVAPEERPLHTVQELQPEAIRAQFEANLRRIITSAKRANTPMLLATLPINLRYAGHQIGHPIKSSPHTAIPFPSYSGPSPCIAEAIKGIEGGDPQAAIDHLASCQDEPADVLRWRGLALLELGQVEEAKTALALSVEITPRNRCRPSLNAIIRRLAAEEPSVYLVDLEARAKAMSKDGIPGKNLFLDYCHMHWRGYYEMAQEVLRVMNAEGLLPGEAPAAPPPSLETLREAMNLNPISPEGGLPTGPIRPDIDIEHFYLENPEPGFGKGTFLGPPPNPGTPPPRAGP